MEGRMMPTTPQKIRKILIANRGEIACRVISTCQNLGIKTVAVYSDVDADSMHVAMADETVHIGPASANQSYLVSDKIISAAQKTSADAIHPGYGFLSENSEFSERCANEGIIFIGPSAASMRAMALKGAAKKLMTDAGVPVVPGYHGDDQTTAVLTAEAEKIGYPILIKAVAGGGGKGMRIVSAPKDLPAAIEAARREGENSFGNGKLLIEKLIEKPRHIELQVFGDHDGNAVHLFERDCSLQRRHQKVVEEAPAPGMTPEMRRAMGDAAVRAAEAINYVGAGTVEFIVDVAGGLTDAPFYFMEMNTRLQVEHPVTEMITGQDLVEWQISVAEGEPLPLSQDEIDVAMHGHAVEVRLYAEDPFNGFLPSIGKIGLFDPFAHHHSNSRVDAGVRAGDSVSIHYDPMIGKLIAWGENREDAIHALIDLVTETPVSGLATNRDFLLRTLSHPEFQAGDVHTGFIPNHEKSLLTPNTITHDDYAIAALAVFADRQQTAAEAMSDDPWSIIDGFRVNLSAGEVLKFIGEDGDIVNVKLVYHENALSAHVGGQTIITANPVFFENMLTFNKDGLQHRYFADITDTDITLVSNKTINIKRFDQSRIAGSDLDGPGTITAPMPGKILELKVKDGDHVSRGDPVLVLEAMKMEQTITAPRDGVVSGLNFNIGDQVKDGAILAEIDDSE
jgi:3-methylcrotonyl-CoA carboxylase alpha subunit